MSSESSLTSKAASRPQFRNIHVSQIVAYSLPPPGLVSILHRISGAALFLCLPLLLWLFDLSLISEMSFERLKAVAGQWWMKRRFTARCHRGRSLVLGLMCLIRNRRRRTIRCLVWIMWC